MRDRDLNKIREDRDAWLNVYVGLGGGSQNQIDQRCLVEKRHEVMRAVAELTTRLDEALGAWERD